MAENRARDKGATSDAENQSPASGPAAHGQARADTSHPGSALRKCPEKGWTPRKRPLLPVAPVADVNAWAYSMYEWGKCVTAALNAHARDNPRPLDHIADPPPPPWENYQADIDAAAD